MKAIVAITVLAVQWGTVGEWVGGLATTGGLVFAGWQILLTRQERQKEEQRRLISEQQYREAMARSVSVQAAYETTNTAEIHEHHPCVAEDHWTWYRAVYHIHNGGDYPIDNVVLLFRDPGSPDEIDDPQAGASCELVIGTLAAKGAAEGGHIVHFGREPYFAEITNLAGLLFTDTWSTHWHRAPNTLERREHPPRIC